MEVPYQQTAGQGATSTSFALAGMYSTIETTQEHRVPGLASIPFLGRIFRQAI
ncbi:hypothetical protein [Pseudomonas protegens]|uniref:hypothetical protein n=1 Tax=Pseudomonas protegens TaxID=380021 RepID=UPI00391AA0D0